MVSEETRRPSWCLDIAISALDLHGTAVAGDADNRIMIDEISRFTIPLLYLGWQLARLPHKPSLSNVFVSPLTSKIYAFEQNPALHLCNLLPFCPDTTHTTSLSNSVIVSHRQIS